MPLTAKEINQQLKAINDTQSLLDMLLEFEGVLDWLDLYAYANWDQGEIVEGPIVERHFVTVKLLYPYDLMPDPQGARRLLKRGIPVKFDKDTLKYAAKIRDQEELEAVIQRHGGRGMTSGNLVRIRNKPKTMPVWIVTIQMPRRFLDDNIKDFVEVEDDFFVDNNDLDSAELTRDQQAQNNDMQGADVQADISDLTGGDI